MSARVRSPRLGIGEIWPESAGHLGRRPTEERPGGKTYRISRASRTLATSSYLVGSDLSLALDLGELRLLGEDLVLTLLHGSWGEPIRGSTVVGVCMRRTGPTSKSRRQKGQIIQRIVCSTSSLPKGRQARRRVEEKLAPSPLQERSSNARSVINFDQP